VNLRVFIGFVHSVATIDVAVSTFIQLVGKIHHDGEIFISDLIKQICLPVRKR